MAILRKLVVIFLFACALGVLGEGEDEAICTDDTSTPIKYTCTCPKGYEKANNIDWECEGKCVDPENTKCEYEDAECEQKESGDSSTVICTCPEDFKKDNNKKWKCQDVCREGSTKRLKCDPLFKKCLTDSEDCGDCMTGYEPEGDKCLDVCREGSTKRVKCDPLFKKCLKDSDDCGDCMTGYEPEGDKCLELCAVGGGSFKECDGKNAECKLTENKDDYTCECKEGFGRKKGEDSKGQCLKFCAADTFSSEDCEKKNAECKTTEGNKDYFCECKDGFGRQKGVDNKGQCFAKLTCKPGETLPKECQDRNAENCVDHEGEHVCDCKQGFEKVSSGDKWNCKAVCEVGTPSSEDCKGKNATCKPENKDYTCECKKGYERKKRDNSKSACQELCTVDTPSFEDCKKKNANCKQTPEKTDYTCECNKGFERNGSDPKGHCQDNCDPNPCKNGGTCQRDKIPLCECPADYLGTSCENLNFCKLDKGEDTCKKGKGKCKNYVSTFLCECESDKIFDYSQKTCTDVAKCLAEKCPENAICSTEKKICECVEGFEMNPAGKCEVKGQCDTKPACPENSDCVNIPGSYECKCKDGYRREYKDLNSTIDKCIKKTCVTQCEGLCLKKVDKSFDCYCEPDKDKTCDLEKPCSESIAKDLCPRDIPDLCTSDDKGRFHCNCTGKYKQSSDGITCELADRCAEGESGHTDCKKRKAKCTVNLQTAEGYECTCPKGYQNDKNGADWECKSLCDIQENKANCETTGQQCVVNSNGATSCECRLFLWNNGQKCVLGYKSYIGEMKLYSPKQLDEIDLFEMTNNFVESMKSVKDVKRVNVLKTEKRDNAVFCKAELQFIAENELDVRSVIENSCGKVPGNKVCIVPPSLAVDYDALMTTEFKPTNPCDKENVNNFCINENSTCTKKHNDFLCQCPKGYRNIQNNGNVDVCQDVCNPSPCQNGGTCVVADDELLYACRCTKDFAGDNCTRKIDKDGRDKNPDKKQVIILGAVLGSIIFLMIIGLCVAVRKLRKNSGSDRYDAGYESSRPDYGEMNERPRPSGRGNTGYIRDQ